MSSYSDTTAEVFNQALEALDGKIAAELHRELVSLLKADKLHDPKQVWEQVRSHAEKSRKASNED